MIKRNFYPILLFCIVLALFIANDAPGKYLTGWDNLQTELAPGLGVKRAFFSVWEEYQSFGLTAGMGHAADLVRAVLLYPVSFVLPQSAIRYIFHMAMVLCASFGMFRLLQFLGFSDNKKSFAFLGAVFYILNFAVIQMLYLPYEAFTIFFGMLPWEVWIFLKTLRQEKPSKKTYLLFILINFLATSQAYAQQVFVVYLLALGLLGIGYFLTLKTHTIFKRVILLFLLIFAVNSFWILPQIYFLKTSGSVVKQAKINQVSTQDIFYANKDKGNLKDFTAFTGFFYDRLDSNQQPLFLPWKTYRETPPVTLLLFILAGIYVLGIFAKKPYQLPFLLVYFLLLTGLLLDVFPFTLLNQALRSNEFINQIFRSPFTKFSILYAFIAAYFFTCGTEIIFTFIQHKVSKKLAKGIVPIITLLVLLQSLPAFQGNYIAAKMKVAIPTDYFAAIDYFHHVDTNKRIALLPDYTFWGWFYNAWGYDGSGFLWYGIEQPIISRTFDVWSNPSESYFWEIKTALEKEDTVKLQQVLDKYNVDYIIYDHSLLPVVANTKAIQYDRIDTMLKQSKQISLEKKWQLITIYKVRHTHPITNFVSIATSMPNSGPRVIATNDDLSYQSSQDYITDNNQLFNKYYPFLDLTTQTLLQDKQWELTETNTEWVISANLPHANMPPITTYSGVLPVNEYVKETAVSFLLPYVVSEEHNKVIVRFPKIPIDTFDVTQTNLATCGNKTGSSILKKQNGGIKITSLHAGAACFSYQDSYLNQQYGYVIKITSSNQKGQKLYFYIADKTKDQPYIEDRLTTDTSYYVIAPRFEHGSGYAFNFQNVSYTNIPTINTLDSVSVYLMPYTQIKELLFSFENTKPAVFTNAFHASKLTYFLYTLTLKSASQTTYILLHQAYHEGWKAYAVRNEGFFSTSFPFLFGKELRNHVLVNNWENGWRLNNPTRNQSNNEIIVILFWPQYLEYIGFFLLFMLLLLFMVIQIPSIQIAIRSKLDRKTLL